VLRGWGAYFRSGNAAIKFVQVDRYVETACVVCCSNGMARNSDPAAAEGVAPSSRVLGLSIKEECLDRISPIGERHIRHVITEFVEHDHRERNHQVSAGVIVESAENWNITAFVPELADRPSCVEVCHACGLT
jgi:hypothetical protein